MLTPNILGDWSGLLVVAAYNPDTNQIRVDKRVLLPPGIWMVLLNHQERHAADDICINNNEVISDIEALVTLDAAAVADGIYTWKISKDNFLKKWKEKGLDFKPEHAVTKLYLADMLLAEPLLEKDVENRALKYLKEYSRELFNR